jgi:glucose-1-phosphate adenylyltransferase
MDLLEPLPPMDLYQDNWAIRSYQAQTPPARAVPGDSATEGVLINSMLAGGTVISGGSVDHSILFKNVFIDDQAMVSNSVIFSNVKVGKKVRLNNCIIDKHVTIPDGEIIGFDLDKDRERFTVTDKGIVVIPEHYSF